MWPRVAATRLCSGGGWRGSRGQNPPPPGRKARQGACAIPPRQPPAPHATPHVTPHVTGRRQDKNTFLPEGLLASGGGPRRSLAAAVGHGLGHGPSRTCSFRIGPNSTFPEALAIDSAVTAYSVPGAAVHQTASLSPAPEGLAQPCRIPHDGCPVTPVQLVP